MTILAHAPKRVQAIRDSAATYIEAVADLEVQVRDPGIRERLQQVRNEVGDVETFFIASLSRESRTAAQESAWLGNAEMALQLAALKLKAIQDTIQHGPNVANI